MIFEDAHGAHLRVPAALEAVADGGHAAARTSLGFEDQHVVATAHQVVRRGEAGQTSAQDDHPLAAPALRLIKLGSFDQCARQGQCAGGGEHLEERTTIHECAKPPCLGVEWTSLARRASEHSMSEGSVRGLIVHMRSTVLPSTSVVER